MPDLDTVKEVRALEHIFICRENCRVLHCTNTNRGGTSLHLCTENCPMLNCSRRRMRVQYLRQAKWAKLLVASALVLYWCLSKLGNYQC